MASLITEIVDVLEEQKECYDGLYTLATYKTRALVDKDVDFLKEVSLREEEFVGRVRLLDKKRDTLFKDVATVTGLAYDDLTLTKIVIKMGEELEISKKLVKLREEHVDIIDKLKKKNIHNQTLIEQSLEFVEFTLNAIQTTQLAGIEANYSRPGYQQNVDAIRVFDAKQ
ncbi:MAG: hypothetical protein ATN34_03275 [Epulopiscium sp. Nele67-Bin002]|nr:MAG: hypothetical protein ATN34_03275 [Epulopiscium sp. Nele67-Bin002]